MSTPTFNFKRHPRGLPRPLGEHSEGLKPTPWSQDQDERGPCWGVIDDRRASACQSHSLCLVCGYTAVKGYVLLRTKQDPRDTRPMPTWSEALPDYLTAVSLRHGYVADNGALHERCLKITRAHCKTIRHEIEDGFWTPVRYHQFDNAADPC